MKHRVTHKNGDNVNGFIYLGEAGYKICGEKPARLASFICPKCGSTFITHLYQIRSGVIRSCGCGKHNMDKISHGKSKTSEFNIWHGMKTRCLNSNNKGYARYGARGIKISPEWVDSFETFLKDMGERPSKKHTLERIDNDGDYCKENCRWATKKEQQRNRRITIFLTHNDMTKPLSEWIEESGLNTIKVRARLSMGWSVEKAFEGKI